MDKTAKDIDAMLQEGRKAFRKCADAENDNRIEALEDIKFAKLGQQWPESILKQRQREFRPALTINKLPSFIRQVVNDARQNKPSIKVRGVDSNSDPKTADVINGLIRNIEYTSNADVAYDTAVENAVAGGFGYIRVGMDYAFDDNFDMDITIERVINPFSVYGDPNSTSSDGSDWDVAFVVDRLPKEDFEAKYGDKANVDFEGDDWQQVDDKWLNDDGVLVAEWWTREEIEREIVLLSDGRVFPMDQIEANEDLQFALQNGAIQITNTRTAKSYKVTQVIMSGVDVLEENEWPGRYIPIIPVYGDEFTIEGKRYFRSLINPAKDAQRMFNYWRTTSTELVALSPRVPWIGRKGTFASDSNRWATANTQSHSYLEYDTEPPQRQPLDVGVAAGALQEALNASDDMKAIIGMYDASLGARSNETSGKAIMARQREGDIATFHFIDNLSRAIRHVGKIIIDLIPHVYNTPRVIRVLGEDKKEKTVQVNQPTPETDPKTGQPIIDEMGEVVMAMHDLTVGKYDLTVEAGPSFTTRREEAAAQMTEMIRAFPPAAPILAGPLAKNMDWPGAQEIADKLETLDPTRQQQGIPPQIQQAIQQGQQLIAQLQAENEQLKQGHQIKAYDAQTKRMKAEGDLQIDQIQAGVDVLSKLSAPPPIPNGQG